MIAAGVLKPGGAIEPDALRPAIEPTRVCHLDDAGRAEAAREIVTFGGAEVIARIQNSGPAWLARRLRRPLRGPVDRTLWQPGAYNRHLLGLEG